MKNHLPLVHQPSSTTFSSLPDEIVVDCLARISKSDYSSLCLVSKSFYSLLSSPEIYEVRSQFGAIEPRVYVCLWLPTSPNYRWFTLSVMNGKPNFVHDGRLASSCPNSNPLHENTVAVGSEIYQIGGTEPSRDVRVLDCWTHTRRRGPDMLVARKFVKCWYSDGKIYVIGPSVYKHKRSNWGEVLDLKTQTWKLMSFPSVEDNCLQVAVFGGRLYVPFKSENNYAYDQKEGRWIRDEWGDFLELEPFGSIYPPWCFIDKVLFAATSDHKYKWYNLHSQKWSSVCGLDDFYSDPPYQEGDFDYNTVRLANYGGKLLVVWHTKDFVTRDMRIWCTVISLEERLTSLGLEIWGKVERSNVVLQVPKSYKFLSCVSVLV